MLMEITQLVYASAREPAVSHSSSCPLPPVPAAVLSYHHRYCPILMERILVRHHVCYCTRSPLDLLLIGDATRMPCCFTLSNGRQDTLADHVHRYRGILFIILMLVSLVLLLMSCSAAARKKSTPRTVP
jgi:hypothetical protein